MLTKRNLQPKKPKILELRPLVPDDLRILAAGRGQKQTVAKLRDSHHMVARLLASGMRFDAVAEISGYSIGAIYRFNADPAMQELVAVYRRENTENFVEKRDNFNELLLSNAMKAERMISDRLDDDDAVITTRDLITITRDAADRTGYGKRSTQVNFNVGMGEAIDAARQRFRARTIEGDAVPSSSLPAEAPSQPSPQGDPLDRRGM